MDSEPVSASREYMWQFTLNIGVMCALIGCAVHATAGGGYPVLSRSRGGCVSRGLKKQHFRNNFFGMYNLFFVACQPGKFSLYFSAVIKRRKVRMQKPEIINHEPFGH